MTASTQSEASTSSDSTAPTTSSDPGLILSNTDPIRTFLTCFSSNLPDDLRKSAISFSSQPSIPYKSLRSIWVASDPATRPPLSVLLHGSSFLFTSPKPREKSEQLKARLKKLEELAERKAYAELVKDITPKKQTDEPFSSYKDQLGFGLHVVVTMFTGYLVGYIAFRALFGRNPIMGAAGGITGLICAMLVETLLFIIRTSDYNDRSSKPKPPSNLRIKKNQ
uniref:ATPase, vacuolar ER assembly factor, Vma12 n=1 Tax=Opuntia streptacantha TaxID=393608 RepID=A0A7C8ZE31_OPUST